ncbi:unnamed protein product [Bubo scandiacus]
MDTEAVQPQEASLTVNEQVIVMSSHETIRVLEVGVDTPLPAEEDRKALEIPPGEVARGSPRETGHPGREDNNPPSTQSSCSGEAAGKAKAAAGASPRPRPLRRHLQPRHEPAAADVGPAGPAGHPAGLDSGKLSNSCDRSNGSSRDSYSTSSYPHQYCRSSGRSAGAGCVDISYSNGRCPSRTDGCFSYRGNFQTTYSQFASCRRAEHNHHPSAGAACPAAAGCGPAPAPPPAPRPPTPPVAKPLETQTQITIQPAGFAFNPGIISAASLGGQTQLLGSLAAAPVIANTISSVQGITGQILTNAQGQVIGTLPWVVNPPGMAAAGPAPAALPAPNLQVQTVTPQLLLNAQGQVIATLAGSAIQAGPPSRKPAPPEPPAKNEVQPIQPAPALSQPAVVVANPAPAAKASSTPVPITCSETPTVSQLVSKPPAPNSSVEEDGINLEEIREFAKNFKIRRLSLGLTQTQVGQALTATEGPAYSQSAICRFEKLDITPKSAQKLKPVLEKWLSEAELRNQEGQQNLMEFVGGEPSKKRKRRTSFTPQAIEALNAYFEKNALPTGQEITEIAKELNYDREVVRVWFCNRRQTLKNTSKLNVFQIP